MGKDVIVACDFASAEETLAFLDKFTDEKPYVKIGMELFYAEGPQIVRQIKQRGHKIFLDLKLHDIPNTVKKAMKVLSGLDVDMCNLHAGGTIAMMEAALEGLTRPDGTRPLLIAVTQLTSTVSPKEAREVSMYRVFGGVNGNYGTGIQEMVTAGDRWDKESQIAEVYLNNMGAFYGDEKNWETVRKAAFEAALTRTDVVVQPRQSNTWGALSLDHVYEFMGGMNLAVRNVTGKDPDAYLADYRNHSNMRMQEVKEAIGIEGRTTIFNPAYIKEKMKGGASSASTFAEIVTNTYGWNVMKPKAIDKEMWDEIYNVYVKDKYNLGTKEFFDKQNPAALMEMTAVMMESARKGMWKATPQQLKDIAKLHTETVNKYKPSCSGFVCDNAKLRNYIASKTDAASAKEYQQNVEQIRDAEAAKNSSDKGMVMKKETLSEDAQKTTTVVSGIVVGVIVIVAFVMLAILIRRRRKNMVE